MLLTEAAKTLGEAEKHLIYHRATSQVTEEFTSCLKD